MRRILFLCTGNSCRSQMAEGWMRFFHGDRYEAFSAGTRPDILDTRAVYIMAEEGVDIESQRSKHVNELLDIRFDLVVKVCDSTGETCPSFPVCGKEVHQPFDDPPSLARDAENKEEALSHYRRVRDEIRDFVLNLPELL